VRLFARILHYVHPKLHNVAAANFEWLGLTTRLTKTLIVDKCSIAAASILKELCAKVSGCCTIRQKATHFEEKLSIIIPQFGVVPGQHFTIKNGIVVADFCACDCPANLDRFAGFK